MQTTKAAVKQKREVMVTQLNATKDNTEKNILLTSLRKYVLHGVAPLLGVEVGLLYDLRSVGGEHAAEEEVDKKYLGRNSIGKLKSQSSFN